ncbi:TetR/AcrR family transcriptional regulator [Sphingomonas sp. MS122]|uniref:TetR/AcrR family transcriptional regulator n=1 Tax=Sphingomonas sp. MS122 TaxID=3412683 RepID=UPI003C30CCBD
MLREAALREVRTSGARNVSMRGLAAALGISAMTAYRYYADKEKLFRDLKSEISERFTIALRAGAQATGNPLDRLRAVAVAYLEFAIAEENEYRLMFDEWLGEVEPWPKVPGEGVQSWHLLIGLIRSAMPGADDNRLVEVGQFLWAGVHGLAMLHLAGRIHLTPPIAATVEPHLDMLLSAIRDASRIGPR